MDLLFLKLIVGIIVMCAPYFLYSESENTILQFTKTTILLLFFHLLLAIITQLFGIFSYSMVLFSHILLVIFLLFKKKYPRVKNIFRKIDFHLVFVIFVSLGFLLSVHYNYTGLVGHIVSPNTEVKNMKYPYPYFVDEWYSVAFIQDSIASKKLPIKNPFTYYDSLFINLELPFHSTLAEIFLLLGLDPLEHYTILSAILNTFIISAIYLFLKFHGVKKNISALASLCALFIVSGANLPGLWTLIPLTLGILSFLFSLFFFEPYNQRMLLASFLLTTLLYPPLMIFCFVSFLAYHLFTKEQKKYLLKHITTVGGVFLLAGALLSLTYFFGIKNPDNFFTYVVKQKIFYKTFTENSIPHFPLWVIVPFPLILGALFAIAIYTRKKLWLFAPLLLTLTYWVTYNFVFWRFFIEYERAIIFSSLLLTISCGFGFHFIAEKINTISFIKNKNFVSISTYFFLFSFILLYPTYTSRDDWKKLTLFNFTISKTLQPVPPANNNLVPDDKFIFSPYSKKRFLSTPWKGTVIGVATDNFPLETKAGTITIGQNLFSDFALGDCERKIQMAKEHTIELAYTKPFTCPNFFQKSVSSEGLVLYEFQR